MKQLGQVEVLARIPWYQNENFWLGFSSSLLASAIFWYFVVDLFPEVHPHRKGHETKDDDDIEGFS